MELINQIIEKALTETLARSTPVEPVNTQTWAKSYRFQTLNDPQLEGMVEATARFEMAALEGRQPRWLTFCGPSGTGKTHLASVLFDRLKPGFMEHPSLLCGALRYVWPRLLPKLRDGAYWLMDDIRDANLLFLDDFGTERPTDFALEKLYELIESRTRKWTILTCNLSVAQIGEHIDTRIASRLMRDGSTILDVNAPDFNLRSEVFETMRKAT